MPSRNDVDSPALWNLPAGGPGGPDLLTLRGNRRYACYLFCVATLPS